MFTTRNRLIVAGLLAGGGIALFALAWWLTTGDGFAHDFRGGRAAPTALRLSGPQVGRFAKVEAEGLRITLPSDRKDVAQVGFSIPLQVQGDFEWTASYEIVDAETPKTGYGVGITIGVDDRARVGRYVRPQGEQVILWDFWPVIDGVRKFEGKAEPCTASSGRMRLARKEGTLHFLWSPEFTGDDFAEIHSTEYGTEPTKFFTLVAESSGQKAGVDVRVLEVRIDNVSAAGKTVRWGAAGLAALGILAGGLLCWTALRPKKALTAAPAPAPAAPEKVEGSGASDGKVSEGEAAPAGKVPGARPAGAKTQDGKPSDAKASDAKAAGDKAAGDKAAGDKAAGDKAPGDKTSGIKAPGGKTPLR